LKEMSPESRQDHGLIPLSRANTCLGQGAP
jgi:hypothetical protein